MCIKAKDIRISFLSENHSYEKDVKHMVEVFFPTSKFKEQVDSEKWELFVKTTVNDSEVSCALYSQDEEIIGTESESIDADSLLTPRRGLLRCIYRMFSKYTNYYPTWGILMGIRPTKLVFEGWQEGLEDEEVCKRLQQLFYTSSEKARLLVQVAHAEKNCLSHNHPKKVSVYIGIPFCPSRCSYCSFSSYTIAQYKDKIDGYLEALEKEIAAIGEMIVSNQLELDTLYIGGGTPTSLKEYQLERLLQNVSKFILPQGKTVKEFTVEAGRPDTITREKLRIMKRYGVDRISINPQTIHDSTLEIIGRKHTFAMFLNAYEMAKEIGFEHINIDIIVGLPSEKPHHIEATMVALAKLMPTALTVHALSIKRGANLRWDCDGQERMGRDEMEKSMNIVCRYVEKMGLSPYYLYRQRDIAGGYENVGYGKGGMVGHYNIQMMEDKETILSAGTGAVSKFVSEDGENIQRTFNVKGIEEYCLRIDEMIQKKQKRATF